MTKVGMITTRAQPEIGGIESHVAEVAGRIAARGYDLEVLTTDRSGRLPRRERVDGYTVRRFRAFPAGRDWYLSPGLFWAALRTRYDVVHVQGIHTLVPPLAMIAAILRRTPFLLTFHTGGNSSAFRERARRTQFRILSPLLRRAHTLVGVSIYEARRFEEIMGLPEGAITVIRNGGSLPVVREPVEPEPALVTSVGRLERYKGHHKAIEALPYLLKTHPEARVEILGSGPYEDELWALAEQLGVREKVTIRLIPPVDRALMGETIARVGVMTLLSDYEAHPVAVMEALTLGRPAVISRTSGLTELADLGWAVGVDQHAGAEETARAIARQLDDPLLPAPADLPTWETCVAGVVDTYDTITGR
ncbi:glycosyltransferase family 4 protein [Nocardioides halotolerans]|uniref:glycosyltransferase family 4 protein n=1 Tax=Nocardioides halotolerans TaxID=433660 RepID=UPI000411D74C|nr:glycosyltransferase family 4 protein [Nocardioides halotolerans]